MQLHAFRVKEIVGVDSTNDTAWVQDVMADANTGFIKHNMMRSGTSVLFTGYGYNYSTSSVLPTNLYWYESTNDTICKNILPVPIDEQ